MSGRSHTSLLLLGDRDRVWLRVAAEAIRATARRDGLSPPTWVTDLELVASARHTETSSENVQGSAHDPTMMPLLYRRDEAAELLRVSSRSVDRLIAAGELRSVRVLKDRRIAREDLIQFVERQRAAGEHSDQPGSPA